MDIPASNSTSGGPASDPSLLAEGPAITADSLRRASEALLAAAEEACELAEQLSSVTAGKPIPDGGERAVTVAESIRRAAALLNEAHGALLFG